jgi:hypothetical protein
VVGACLVAVGLRFFSQLSKFGIPASHWLLRAPR